MNPNFKPVPILINFQEDPEGMTGKIIINDRVRHLLKEDGQLIIKPQYTDDEVTALSIVTVPQGEEE